MVVLNVPYASPSYIIQSERARAHTYMLHSTMARDPSPRFGAERREEEIKATSGVFLKYIKKMQYNFSHCCVV